MLRPDIVDACKSGNFHIYSISHIDQGIEILTGRPAGKRHSRTSEFPEGTINRLVEDQLIEFALLRRDFGRGKRSDSASENTDSAEASSTDNAADKANGSTSRKSTKKTKKKTNTKRTSKKKGISS